MWQCKVCDTEIEDDSWNECWKCSHDRRVTLEESETLRLLQSRKEGTKPQCLRCGTATRYAGTKRFHEGSNPGFLLGDIGHLFQNKEWYDVYFCHRCGKVEFFVDGIGDAERGETCDE